MISHGFYGVFGHIVRINSELSLPVSLIIFLRKLLQCIIKAN